MEYTLLKKIIAEFLSYHKIGFEEEQIVKLNTFLELLSKWNTTKRLVGKFSEIEILTDLILDSILPVLWLKGRKGLVDIGSGAGIPGIPIKIFIPEMRVYTVEPIGKKVSFLREVQRKCCLHDLIILKGRLEEVASSIYSVDTAISRALGNTGSIVELLEKANLKVQYLLCYSSSEFIKEEKSLLSHFVVKDTLNYTLPTGRSRCLILLEDLWYGPSVDSMEGPMYKDLGNGGRGKFHN